MIRYAASRAQLEHAVDQTAPKWRADAATRTAKLKKKKKYDEKAGAWSTIKSAYMTIQFDKCAYCERKLAALPYGAGEHDVEHFRPKSSCKVWPTPAQQAAREIAYRFGTGLAYPTGYYWLAYDLYNYATACRSCNSSLKSNAFPIAGHRAHADTLPEALSTEKPFLVYPIGKIDADPENLIGFNGIVPVARKKSGHAKRRAQVTIDFFELDTRPELLKERAGVIATLGLAFGGGRQDFVNAMIAESSPHASCARAFKRLWDGNQSEAQRLHRAAMQYIASGTDRELRAAVMLLGQ